MHQYFGAQGRGGWWVAPHTSGAHTLLSALGLMMFGMFSENRDPATQSAAQRTETGARDVEFPKQFSTSMKPDP